MDEPFLELTPGPTIDVPPPVIAARAALTDAAARLAAVPDAAMPREWPWRGGEQEIRYGYYHAGEVLDAAAAATHRALEEAGVAPAPGARIAAPATAARWDLHGILTVLDDEAFDADPGGGEWTIRQVLGHMINGQRAYAWFSAWWLSRAGEPPLDRVPDDVLPTFPEEEVEGVGSFGEVRDRLDAILDLSVGRMGALGDDALAAPARWSGYPVTVGFRIGRWASHLREHTIQVEKTLVMLDRPTSEVDRLVRLVLARYGILESTVFGLPAEALERPGADGRTPAGIIAEAAAEITRATDEVVEGARLVAAE